MGREMRPAYELLPEPHARNNELFLEKLYRPIYYISGCTECQPAYPSQHLESLPKETKEIRYHKLQNLARNIKMVPMTRETRYKMPSNLNNVATEVHALGH